MTGKYRDADTHELEAIARSLHELYPNLMRRGHFDLAEEASQELIAVETELGFRELEKLREEVPAWS